jgi:signal transduction histidine kinase
VPPLLSPAQLAEALQGRPPIVDVVVAGRPGRAVGVRRDESGRTYVVVAGLFRDGLHRNLRHLSRFLLAVWLAGVLLTAGLGRGLASRVLRPVTAITDRAAAIAGGDLRGRLGPPLADDEIGRMTERLNAMLERLQDALEANRRFAASASHELRTPLAAIRAEVEVVLRRERTPEEYRQALLAVGSRALEMGELIADLRALVRALEGRPELELREVPLEAAIEASLTRQKEPIERRGLEVETSGLAGLVAYGDARLLARLFDNLLANGARHCRLGGKLGVRGEAEAGGPGWNSGRVRLWFSNQGPAIPAEEWERIFAPFTRGTLAEDAPPEAGLGLGLAIAREVARLHHGQVRVLDSGDEGTTFEVVLRGDRLTPL